MRKKETPNPSRMRGRGVEVSETLFYAIGNYSVMFLLHKKRSAQEAHAREDVTCRKRPRSARECALAHSFYINNRK